MRIEVHRPEIDGEFLRFHWTQTEPNAFQLENSFFLRYENLELAAFSDLLFYEIFLALQLKVFRTHGKPVCVSFPEAIPESTVAYWQAFHRAESVEIGPILPATAYSPVVRPDLLGEPTKHAAVFFGGGKDSSLAAAALSEIFGPEQVRLIQFVCPLGPNPKLMGRNERRQERLMLEPTRETLGVESRRVWTDYQANFRPGADAARPHLEIFTVGSLPHLLASGAKYSTFGSTRSDYLIIPTEDGGRRYKFASSRPEVLETQSIHYRRALGFDHTVTNVNFPYSTYMDVRFLAHRYPHAMLSAVMCTYAKERDRWCYTCGKCMNYAIYTLGAGFVDPRFDYTRAFEKTRTILRAKEYAATGVELGPTGNAPWAPGMFAGTVFHSICHALAVADPGILRGRLSKEAESNLYTLIALFGNREIDSQRVLAREVIDFPNVDLVRDVAALAAHHFAVVDRLPPPETRGDDETIIDFQTRMPTPTTDVPHVRAAMNPPGSIRKSA